MLALFLLQLTLLICFGRWIVNADNNVACYQCVTSMTIDFARYFVHLPSNIQVTNACEMILKQQGQVNVATVSCPDACVLLRISTADGGDTHVLRGCYSQFVQGQLAVEQSNSVQCGPQPSNLPVSPQEKLYFCNRDNFCNTDDLEASSVCLPPMLPPTPCFCNYGATCFPNNTCNGYYCVKQHLTGIAGSAIWRLGCTGIDMLGSDIFGTITDTFSSVGVNGIMADAQGSVSICNGNLCNDASRTTIVTHLLSVLVIANIGFVYCTASQ